MYGVTQHATRSLMLRALAACMDAAGGWIYTDKQYEKCHLEYIEVHESSLDRSTLASLEVISNQQTGRQDGSLLGLFKTCTKVGKDLLTETLKAPLTSKRMIEQRFDFLEELRRNDDEALNEITRVLKTQKGLDAAIQKLNGHCAMPSATTCTVVHKKLVAFRQGLRNLSFVIDALEAVHTKKERAAPNVQNDAFAAHSGIAVRKPMSSSYRRVMTTLGAPHWRSVLKLIEHDLREEYDEKTQDLWQDELCLKPSQYEILLTVANERCHILNRMRDEFVHEAKGVLHWMRLALDRAKEFVGGTEKTEVAIEWSLSLGYFYSVSSTPADCELVKQANKLIDEDQNQKEDRGYEFCPVSVNRGKRSIFCLVIDSSAQWFKEEGSRKPYNNGLLKKIHERIVLRQAIFLEKLVDEIQALNPPFIELSNTIAFLDMMQSFGQFIKDTSHKGTSGLCRPTFVDKDDFRMHIKGARHLLIEIHQGNFRPYDVEMTHNKRVQMVLAPNSAGKSTYLTSIGIICLLAQCGCFVPAQSAVLPVFENIMSRVG